MDPLWSSARDGFMSLQVKKEHEKNSDPLIVITGAAHALMEPYAPIKKNWTPMAASLTTQYKEKICTVFLWKRGTFFPIYISKKTKKQLLKSTQKGNKYLFDVNREKEWMPELMGKYTYLLVY